jgi:hypothetical protein
MQQVRVGGRYDESREQRLWAALLGLIALATVGIVVVICDAGSGFTIDLLGWAPGSPPSDRGRLGRPVTRRLRSVRNGRQGERLVADLLRGLPDDYWLVNDVSLGLARGTIDHVLIGPCGVVVIDTKDLAGHIRCWENSWSVNGYRQADISQRVNPGRAPSDTSWRKAPGPGGLGCGG